jgi:magnesium transporter
MNDSNLKNLNEPIVDHLHINYASVMIDHTVGQTLDQLRNNPPEGRIIYFYVIDQNGILKGVVPTRRLLLSDPETPVAEIMVREVIAIPYTATVLDACEFFIMHRLLAFPVIDDQRRMLGVIDVELYTTELGDIERSERSDELFQLIGVHITSAHQVTPFAAMRYRFPWLMCNIVGGIIASFITGLFEKELHRIAALALFIPVVLAIAESVSIQSLSITLQLLRGQSPTMKLLSTKIRSELASGFMLGISAAVLVSIVAWLWRGQTQIIFALLGGIAGGAACAAAFGSAMPTLLRLFQRDPQVAAGPIALAASDMVTLLIYFYIASLIT